MTNDCLRELPHHVGPVLSRVTGGILRVWALLGVAGVGLGLVTPGASAAQDVELDGVGHVLGSRDAPVSVVEFGDFGCGACALFHETTFPAVMEEFVETGRVQWRHVPFVFGFCNGDDAARGTECAADQGQYWEMHDVLFRRRAEWQRPRNPKDLMLGYAVELGMQAEAFEQCYKDNDGKERTRRATRAADELDLTGTPAFFINGSPALGALTMDVFRGLLEKAEREANPGG